jgi:hypothetical protein
MMQVKNQPEVAVGDGMTRFQIWMCNNSFPLFSEV